jgi:hypothetical protein
LDTFDESVNLLPLDVEMTRPSALAADRMIGVSILPHDRPPLLSALTPAALWPAFYGNGLLDGVLHRRSSDNGEDQSRNKNQGHEASLHQLSRTDGFDRRHAIGRWKRSKDFGILPA